MMLTERARRQRGRHATLPWLRWLAALVALLLTASALGQTAHFLLVPHTICAEHGELLELGEGSAHEPPARATDNREAGASAPTSSAEHEHCQILARGQREQALPQAASGDLVPAALHQKQTIFAAARPAVDQLARLDLAPKTSPPRARAC